MHYSAGWDVGSWHCDDNPNSRDALAVLAANDGKLGVAGNIFRGNIRSHLNRHKTLAAILNECCGLKIAGTDSITIAIDTPLGMPKAVADLINDGTVQDPVPADFSDNTYLYRQTERWLFEKGFSPLSAIKDMIGSQATKGMHFLAKFKLKLSEGHCGVWNTDNITAVETYPTPVMTSAVLRERFTALGLSPLNDDKTHAVYCALLSYLFVHDRSKLIGPQNDPPRGEGWIWIPTDAAR